MIILIMIECVRSWADIASFRLTGPPQQEGEHFQELMALFRVQIVELVASVGDPSLCIYQR